MTERAPVPRRRERNRPSASALPARLPRLENPWRQVEIVTDEQTDRIIGAASTVLEEMGLEIRSRAAWDIYRAQGGDDVARRKFDLLPGGAA